MVLAVDGWTHSLCWISKKVRRQCAVFVPSRAVPAGAVLMIGRRGGGN